MQNIVQILFPGFILAALVFVLYKIMHYIYLVIVFNKSYAYAYMFDIKSKKYKHGETVLKKGDKIEVYVKEKDEWISGIFFGISKQEYFKVLSTDISQSLFYIDMKQEGEFKLRLKKE